MLHRSADSSPEHRRTTPMRRRGIGQSPVKNNDMSHPTPTPPRAYPDPESTPDEFSSYSSGSPGSPSHRAMDHTPSSRQFSSSEFLSTRKNLDSLFGDNKVPPPFLSRRSGLVCEFGIEKH